METPVQLQGKVALVTGGAHGIGRAVAEDLVRQGCKVCICDVESSTASDLARHLGTEDRIISFTCDVTDYSQFEEAFQHTSTHFGTQVDILVNNAGLMNDRLWELEVDVNLNGTIRGVLLALRHMGKDRGGKGGIVVNLGSNVCVRPYVSVPIYTATKHAVIGLTKAYGDEFHVKRTGVKVVALCPGATESNLIHGDVNRQLLGPEYEAAWKKDTIGSVTQPARHVASTLVHVLRTAPSASCWLVERSLPPKQILASTG